MDCIKKNVRNSVKIIVKTLLYFGLGILLSQPLVILICYIEEPSWIELLMQYGWMLLCGILSFFIINRKRLRNKEPIISTLSKRKTLFIRLVIGLLLFVDAWNPNNSILYHLPDRFIKAVVILFSSANPYLIDDYEWIVTIDSYTCSSILLMGAAYMVCEYIHNIKLYESILVKYSYRIRV